MDLNGSSIPFLAIGVITVRLSCVTVTKDWISGCPLHQLIIEKWDMLSADIIYMCIVVTHRRIIYILWSYDIAASLTQIFW